MAFQVPAVPRITGSTEVFLILGAPVRQVKAPEAFNRVFARFGIDAVLVPMQVAVQDLKAFVRAAFLPANVRGLWVTIPHKEALFALVDEAEPQARAAGAVNAVRREPSGATTGALFDGAGFVDGLALAGIQAAGRRVLVLGAGGAAAAIGASLMALSTGSLAELAFFDPVPGRAQALAQRLAEAGSAPVRVATSNRVSGFDLVINASPLGLRADDPLPCEVGDLAPDAAVVDILMKNQPTPLLRAARARHLRTQPGFEMLIQQTHRYLDFFGYHEAAASVRADADFIRKTMVPPEWLPAAGSSALYS